MEDRAASQDCKAAKQPTKRLQAQANDGPQQPADVEPRGTQHNLQRVASRSLSQRLCWQSMVL